MRFELKYMRTDRNGTKYYADCNCPRCSGFGELDKWAYTGRVCFACGGTGLAARPKTIKVYTPEYEAKLDARRAAKAAKYQEEHAEEIAQAKAEAERTEAERKHNANVKTFRELGCGDDGVGYVLTGNTYRVKEEIKAIGGKWIAGTWVSPVRYDNKGITVFKIDISTLINEYGLVNYYDGMDKIWETAHR